MKRTRISAIDVGATKVCTIMADTDAKGNLRILGVGIAASQGIEKNVMVNNRHAATSISQSVGKAEKMAGYRLKSAYVGISDTEMSSRNNCGVVSISRNDQLVHAVDRRRALDVAQSIEVPDDQELLHVVPRAYTLDDQENIQNPVGMCGFRLAVETHIVTTPTMSVQNLTRCIMHLGIGIDGMVLGSLASAEAVLTEDERQRGVVLADIGGAVTDIAVFKDSSVCHTSTLPVGGHHITNDIAVGLGLPFGLAEEMKKKHGSVIPFEEERDVSEVTITEKGRGILYHDLYQIISARVEELLRLIIFQVPRTGYTAGIPAGLVLTGGSSGLSGIAELGREVTGLPVRVASPIVPDSDSETLQDPAYATGVGLVYWQMGNQSFKDLGARRRGLGILPPKLLSYLGSRN
jgi:cell division protein FtsA